MIIMENLERIVYILSVETFLYRVNHFLLLILKFNFLESSFINHYGNFDASEIYLWVNLNRDRLSFFHQENAGVFYLRVNYLNVSQCYFSNNSNFRGGVFYFERNEKYINFFLQMEKSIFLKNDAGEGGAGIYFSTEITYTFANITNCFFAHSIAWCKEIINLIFCFLF